MYKTFGETIASLRRAHGMRQQTLADALAEAGVPVSNQAVSKWENDATLPNAQQFLTLCRVLDVDDIAGTFSGGDAGGLLAGLNAEGRRRALQAQQGVQQTVEGRAGQGIAHGQVDVFVRQMVQHGHEQGAVRQHHGG